MTRESSLGRIQERGLCWLGLFAGHGAHGAGACRALCVEVKFRHRGQPGHHARTCSQQTGNSSSSTSSHLLSKGCSSTASCTPLQHLWGRKAHTQRDTCTHTHVQTHIHIHSHACACAHTYKHKHARVYTQAHTHTHKHMHTHKYTRAHTYKRPNTQAHTRAHTHAHVHMHAHVARVMGFANFSASLALLPHLSTFLSNTAGDPRVSTAAGPIHDTLRQSSPTPTGVCHQLSR
jgi:hypothetical protein